MVSYECIALVTGSNKGIGLAIVRQLALQYPSSPANKGSLLIYLTARDKSRGEAALENIQHDKKLKDAKALASYGGLSDVRFHELDISKTKSIQAFSEYLKTTHPDGVDMVINNAGVALDGYDDEIVKKTLECNYYGTLEATQDFLRLIRPGGRLVNVASAAGLLRDSPSSLRQRFPAARTHDEITAMMEEFKAAAKNGTEAEYGWPRRAYSVSKAGVIGVTRTIAEEEQKKGSKVLINSCCPGYVVTDMTKGGGHKTPDQGAQTPVMLALQDIGGKTGLFWENEKVREW